MIDFHSHILPAMDDGSRNIEESLQMLRMLQEQGVERVIATPHFYADENPPDVFLRRRADAWEHLRAHLTQGLPHVLLGAEVHYFQGISRTAQVRQLCIQDTGVLLLEMPFSGWFLPHGRGSRCAGSAAGDDGRAGACGAISPRPAPRPVA